MEIVFTKEKLMKFIILGLHLYTNMYSIVCIIRPSFESKYYHTPLWLFFKAMLKKEAISNFDSNASWDM